MRLKEQKLWDTMKRNKPSMFWLQRIENSVGDGMADVVCIARPQISWVELKAPIRPKRETTPLMGKKEGLSVGQINWHLKMVNKGQRAFVLIRDDTGELFLVPSKYAATMNESTVKELRQISVAFTWESVYEVLS